MGHEWDVFRYAKELPFVERKAALNKLRCRRVLESRTVIQSYRAGTAPRTLGQGITQSGGPGHKAGRTGEVERLTNEQGHENVAQPARGKRSTRQKEPRPSRRASEVELPSPERSSRDERAESEIILRNPLSKHLHDLLNALWPIAVRIELSISDSTCPPHFQSTLTELAAVSQRP